MDDSKLRLSTREREAALESLSTHFADGRLTVEEFDERAAEVAKATTRGELAPLFADLPESRTSSLVNVTDQREVEELLRRKKRVELIHGGVWAVTFILFFCRNGGPRTALFLDRFPHRRRDLGDGGRDDGAYQGTKAAAGR